MTEILTPGARAIERCVEALRRSDVVAMPTETVYGLAGSAFDEYALARIFAVKDRPFFDPLIVHVSPALLSRGLTGSLLHMGLADLRALGEPARAAVESLAEAFWPGPLTLVLPKLPAVPDLATSGLPTVGVRMPAHAVAQALISAFGGPLAAPSANRFGRISPTSARAVLEELGGRIPFVLDGGPCLVGVESTVVRLEDDEDGVRLRLLRSGKVTPVELQGVARLPVVLAADEGPGSGALPSPGLLDVHYAPAKPILLVSSAEDAELARARLARQRPETVALLGTGPSGPLEAWFRDRLALPAAASPRLVVLTLAEDGLSETAARNLFARLREADASEASLLLARPPAGEDGLSAAIRDRLTRASGRPG